MKLNRKRLKAACHKVAKTTMWAQQPIDAALIEALAERFLKIAEHHEPFIVEQGRDPNLITRAVHYLAYSHAMPPMNDDTNWFSDMLDVLVELACPNSIGSRRLELFYRDIEEGIAESRSHYQTKK
jgi:hypothetical protein